MCTARLLLPLAVLCLTGACRWFAPSRAGMNTPAGEALAPSPRLIVGRILAVDPQQHFAFVELAADAPMAAATEGSELLSRTGSLLSTGRLRASRYLRGRTLGTIILEGRPAPGNEVVWLAP